METRIAGHDTLLSLCLGCVIAETLTNQMEKYLNGEAVYLKGMKRSDGQTFDACVQFSARTRKNDFTHPEWLKEALKAEKEALKKMESLGEKQGEDTGKKKGRSH